MSSLEYLYQLFLQSTGVSTDTRKIAKGNIYVALKGPNFNGNHFAKQSLESGADYCIIDESDFQFNDRCLLVDDALRTLQQLSHLHRKQLNIPLIAICGSNGKTTTKELTGAVLKTTYNTFVTQGNLNNHIGVPLTLLSLNKQHQMAVIEIGSNHLKETEALCDIAAPDFGLITNNGKDHLEGYGSIELVRQGNGEFYEYVKQHGGHVFVSEWQEDLINQSEELSRTVYGYKNAKVKGQILSGDYVKAKIIIDNVTEFVITSQLVGDYNIENIMAAVAIGNHFKVPVEKIKEAIEEYIPGNNRSQLVIRGSNKIIVDCYNANPSSMELAINNLSKYSGKKILIAGDMYELGSYSSEEHLRMLQIAKNNRIEHIWLVGSEFSKANEHISIAEKVFPGTKELIQYVSRNTLEHFTILLKGSRAMKLEQVLEVL